MPAAPDDLAPKLAAAEGRRLMEDLGNTTQHRPPTRHRASQNRCSRNTVATQPASTRLFAASATTAHRTGAPRPHSEYAARHRPQTATTAVPSICSKYV